MSPHEKATIAEMMVIMVEVSGKTFSQAAIIHMVESIDDLEFQAVANALKNWSRTERNFPHPSDIREKILPEVTGQDDALDAANRVISAVGKHGYTNPDKARTAIGELGWTTVAKMGGWKHMCEVLNHDNEGMFRAQIRAYADTVRRKAIRGELDQAPELPSPNQVQGLISKTMKGIE